MNGTMSGLVFILFLFLFLSPVSGGSVVNKKFIHIDDHHHTWNEALEYCRSHFSDLAIVQSVADKELMTNTYFTWIGVSRVGVAVPDQWKWISGKDLANNDERWFVGEPGAEDACVSVYHTNRKFYGSPCEQFFFFYCNIGRRKVFVPESRTWSGAQESCLQRDGSLLSLEYAPDVTYIDVMDFPLWVKTVEGTAPTNDSCVALQSSEKTTTFHDCTQRFPFVCMEDNVLMMEEKKSWEDAMEHCRALVLYPGDQSQYELLNVQDGQDQDFIRSRLLETPYDQVWVGLRFLGGTWFWIDGVPMEYPDLPVCPPPGKHCGVISKMAAGVETADCGEKKNFLCYRLTETEMDD